VYGRARNDAALFGIKSTSTAKINLDDNVQLFIVYLNTTPSTVTSIMTKPVPASAILGSEIPVIAALSMDFHE